MKPRWPEGYGADWLTTSWSWGEGGIRMTGNTKIMLYRMGEGCTNRIDGGKK